MKQKDWCLLLWFLVQGWIQSVCNAADICDWPAADPDVGSIDLQCSDVFFNVTYELQRRGERHGTILALNITCEGLDNEIRVVRNGAQIMANRMFEKSISVDGYFSSGVIDCTLYGCYESIDFDHFVLQNSSCHYNVQVTTPPLTTNLLTTNYLTTDDDYTGVSDQQRETLILLPVLITGVLVLLGLSFLTMVLLNWRRTTKIRQRRSINFQYNGPEVAENDNIPVKIDVAISASPSAESLINKLNVFDADMTRPSDIPEECINMEKHSSWDSISTTSYIGVLSLSPVPVSRDSQSADHIQCTGT